MVQEEVPASAAHDVGEGPGWPGSPLLPGSPCGDEWLSGLQPLAPPALDLPLPCDGEAAFPLDVIGPPAGVAPASCSLAPGAPIDALPQGGALAGPQQDASMLGYPQLPACAGPLHLQLLGRLPSAPVAVCAAEPGGRDGATMAARCESLPRTRSGGAWQGRSKPLEEYKRDPEIHRRYYARKKAKARGLEAAVASKLAEFNELLALNLELRKNEQVLSCYIGARDEQLHHLARLSALSLSSGSSQGDAPSGTSSSTRGSDASGAQTSAGSLEQDAAATPQWRAAQAAEPLAAERPRPAGPEARSGASAAAPSPPGCTGPLAAGRQVSLQTASSGGDDMHCEAAAPGASPSVAPAVGAGPAPNVAGPHAAAVAVAVAVAGPAAQTAAAGAPGALPAGACQSQQDVLETYARCVHRVAPLVGAAQAGHPEALALVEAHVREMEEAMAKWMWKNPGTLMQMGGMHLFQPGVRADDSLWSRVACAVPFGGRCGAVTAWRQHLGALAAVMERQKALATKLRAMMAEDQGVQSRGTRLQSLVDMFAITDALRRTLDEEGELWLLYLIAARKITPSVNRAAAMVNCFPFFPDGPAISRERVKGYLLMAQSAGHAGTQ